ncbi:DUF4864 domain-containing protein [Thermocoleostomius sinensis]|uniref:DUF4864 domain-containing protein n=1 Tax=Thermocoleostomius sinensis A174 TaxID=2016057 RepID=A0A9E8ZFC4_9CYAN|nr:DUF4864 domain-containing protein [Thermocoleostomius sinensis]WAL60323.1 DUF4864 domain-containing protein [Thermocoleostomius sinensis A174]
MLPSTDRQAIRAIIERQLAAFQRDDATEAFTFASPGIQAQFGTAKAFMRMVRLGYPAVYRPRAIVFQELTTVEAMPAQKVLLMGPEGTIVMAVYLMQQQPDDSWRIHGCFLMPVDDQVDGQVDGP